MQGIDVLYLRPSLPAITYRPYTDEIGGFSLIGWLLGRLAARRRNRNLLVLCHDDFEREQVRAHAEPLGVPVLRASGNTRLEALADLALAVPGAHIAAFRPEVALAPSTLLDDVWRHHVAESNNYTRVENLPPEIGVEIFDCALLAAIGGIEFPGAPPELTHAVQRLVEMRPALNATPFACAVPPRLVSNETGFDVESALDVSRACASLTELPAVYEWEALECWRAAEPVFQAPSFGMCGKSSATAVLYLSPCSGYSGAEDNLRVLVQGMGERGWTQYAVVGEQGLLAERLRLAGADVFCPNWPFHCDTPEGHRFAAQLFNTVSVDVVHCNSEPGLPVLREARRRGIPVVTHVRVAHPEALRHALRMSDHFIAISAFIRARLLAAGVPEDRITVVYDGIDTARFRPGVLDRKQVREKFGVPADAFVVLLIARLAPNKRHDLLLHAARLALKDVPALHLVFVGRHGNPALERQITNLCDQLGMADRLLWLSFQEDIRQIECASDVVVLCSDSEPLGICVIEAMALGVPVAVSDSGGTHELVCHGESGLVFPGGDAAALAATLSRLAADPALRHRISQCARRRAKNLFTVAGQAAATARVFDAVRVRR